MSDNIYRTLFLAVLAGCGLVYSVLCWPTRRAMVMTALTVGDRVRICRTLFEGQHGTVTATGPNGVQLSHTLGPMYHEHGQRIERAGVCRNWFSPASLEKIAA